MKAPLPEVPPVVPKSRDFVKVAPPGLSAICALQIFIIFLGLLIRPIDPSFSGFWKWTAFGLLNTLAFLLIAHLWRGYGWARVITLYLVVLGLFPELYPEFRVKTGAFSRANLLLHVLEMMLWVWTFLYLNLPAVKIHFARREAVK